MKKRSFEFLVVYGFLVLGLCLVSSTASGQDITKAVSGLPDSVNKIFSASCTPCHTNDGGLMSKAKLNFTEWTNYSPEKQREKAAKIYEEIQKGSMPPKKAREKNPELIPTIDQVEIIRKWVETFPADTIR